MSSVSAKREFNYKKEWLQEYQATHSKHKGQPQKSTRATVILLSALEDRERVSK